MSPQEIRIRKFILDRPQVSIDRLQSNMRHFARLTFDQIRTIRESLPSSASPAPAARSASKPIALLRVEFDDVGKVRSFMKRLPKSEYVEDMELRRELKISDPRWREVKLHPSLSEYQFVLPNKKVVWMHAEAQATLRSAIDLSSP